MSSLDWDSAGSVGVVEADVRGRRKVFFGASVRRVVVAAGVAVAVLGGQLGVSVPAANADPAEAKTASAAADVPLLSPGGERRHDGFVPGGGADVSKAAELRRVGAKESSFDEKTSVPVPEETTDRKAVWKNRDGTFTAKLASAPVRVRDAGGVWRDIDMSLVDDGAGRLRPKVTPTPISVSKQSGGADLVEVTAAKGAVLRLGAVGAGAVAGRVGKTHDEVTATFPAALDGGVDVQVQPITAGVKTTYVIPNVRAASRVLREQIELPAGWTARQARIGVVELLDGDGAVAARWTGGPVEEAAPKRSESVVGMTLEGVKGRVATARLSLDAGWMAAPDRHFPVLIDPELRTYTGGCCGSPNWDSWVNERYPDNVDETGTYWNYGNFQFLDVGNKYGLGTTRSIVRFDTSSIPSTARVTLAALYMTEKESYDGQCHVSRTGAAPANPGWDESSTWWNNPDALWSAEMYTPEGWNICPEGTPTWYEHNVPWLIGGLVQAWVNRSLPNFGEVLAAGGPNSDEDSPADYKRFYSGDSGTHAPMLIVDWDTEPINQPPGMSQPVSPADKTIVTTTTPTLTATSAADPNPGDVVHYWFRIATTGVPGTGGLVADSGLQPLPTFTVPEGFLRDGVTYYWTAYTLDDHGGLTLTDWVRSFTVKSRLGDSAVSATDQVGPVAVNLVNGNAVVKVSSPTVASLGGNLGISYVYNSRAVDVHGLTGEYYFDYGTHEVVSGQTPFVVRTDAGPNFMFGSSPPAGGMLPFRYIVRWTGVITAPVTGTYRFGASVDDGARIYLNGSQTPNAYNNWTVKTAPPTGCDFTGSTSVSMTAGQAVPVKIEYFQDYGTASMQVCASMPDGSVVTTPSSWYMPVDASPMPRGWTMSAGADLQYSWAETVGSNNGMPSVVVVHDATGASHSWNLSPDRHAYTPPADESGTLVVEVAAGQPTSGQITLQADDGYTYRFDPSGRLMSATTATDDRNPAAPTYQYGGTPVRLRAITDPTVKAPTPVRQIKLDYVSDGVCPNTSGLPGGLLCRVEYPDGSRSDFTYQMAYGDPWLLRVTDPGNAVTDFGYGINGLLTQVRDPLAYDQITAGMRAADDNALTTINYTLSTLNDNNYRVGSIVQPAPIAGDPRPEHDYTYTVNTDGAGSATVDAVGFTPAAGHARQVSFNALGQTTGDTDAAGKTTTAVWDNTDRKQSDTDPAGLQTTYAYDTASPAHRLTSVTGPLLPAYSGQKPVQVTNYDENLHGLAAAYWPSANFGGAPTVHSTGVGDASGALNANWGASAPAGLAVVDNWSARFTGEVSLPASGLYRFRVAQDDGARLFIDGMLIVDGWDKAAGSYSGGYTNSDTAHRHTIRVDYQDKTGNALVGLYWTPPGGSEQLVPGANLFPSYGLVTSTVDADGHRVSTEYSRSGEVGPEIGLPTATVVDPNGSGLRSETHYEPAGPTTFFRRTSRTLPKGAATAVTYSYYGPSETRTLPAECGGGTSAVQAGALKTTTDADPDGTGPAASIVHEQIYDALGRVVAYRITSDSTWNCRSYDARGRVLTETDTAGHATSYSYTPPGTVTTTAVDSAGATRTTTAAVDLLGRPVSYRDENGTVTATLYDRVGRKHQQNRTMPNPADSRTPYLVFDYDNAGRPATLTEYASGSARTTTYGYDNYGRPSTVTRPNGVVTTTTYDPNFGWTTALSNKKGTTELSPWTYGHALSGKVSSETTTGRSRVFTFDNAGRLTKTVEGTTTRNYQYDADGNRCSADTPNCLNVATYTYDNADRLTASPYASGYTYDSHGNLKTATPIGTPPPDTTTQTFGFDARNSVPTPTQYSVSVAQAGTLTANLAWAQNPPTPPTYQTGSTTGTLSAGQTATAATLSTENQTDLAATVNWPQATQATTSTSASVTTGTTSATTLPISGTGTVSATVDWQPTTLSRTASGSAPLLGYTDIPFVVSTNGAINATLTDTSLLGGLSLALLSPTGTTLATANPGVPLTYTVSGLAYPSTAQYKLRVNAGLLGGNFSLAWTHPALARVSLGLYNPAGTLVAQSANTTTKPNTLTYAVPAGATGSYSLKVIAAADPNAPAPYAAAFTMSATYPVAAYADVTVNLVDPSGAVAATTRSSSGSATVRTLVTSGGNWQIRLLDNSTNLAASWTTNWSATTTATDSASGSLAGGATTTRAVTSGGQGYLNATLTWTQSSGAYADVSLNVLNPNGVVLASSRSSSGSATVRYLAGGGSYTLQLVNNSASVAVPSWQLTTTYPSPHNPRFVFSIKNPAGTTVATTTATTSPTVLSTTATAGTYTIVAAPQAAAGNATVTTSAPGRALVEQIGYDPHDHATTINDGTNTVTEVLAPSGRVLRRTVRDNTTNTVVEDIVNGYADASDSPAWSKAASGAGPLTSYIAGTLTVDTGSTPVYPIANGHGDIVGTTDTAGIFSAAPATDEFGRGQTALNRLGWLGTAQRQTADTRLGLIRMGVRLYDPNLGRFLQTDPIEGGSANDYDYAFGDPINNFDLNGTCVEDACVGEALIAEGLIMYGIHSLFGHKAYYPPPRTLPAFPGAQRVRPKTGRYRWEDDDYIYEWDSQHGRVEKYSKKTGEHLGEFDPKTGKQTKPPKKGRRTVR